MNTGAIIAITLMSVIVSIMLFPMGGIRSYFRYKRPLFILAVIFMPLFVLIAVALGSGLDLEKKVIAVLIAMAGFWGSAALLGLRATQGEHVPGLKFRPDLILPGGVNFVKGTIMTGMGMMLSFQVDFGMPEWNWWGFILAFWGILLLIPIRGMYKMLLRQRRLVGNPKAVGKKAVWLREILLIVGLEILIYGFLNAFMGKVPFTTLWPIGGIGWIFILIGIAILLARGFYKVSLAEGGETGGQLFFKQLILYAGTLFVLYGNASANMGQLMTVQYESNSTGFTIGLGLVVAGAFLVLVARPAALRNEWEEMVASMMGMLSDMPLKVRKMMITSRLRVLAKLPDELRHEHLRIMLMGRDRLPGDLRSEMMRTMMEAMSELGEEERARVMTTMNALM
ncbi:hypothetical protein [Terrihalobacillus insolitus]|uniref:hypothetical protein n=1 Tax=Terrihalobacillus insolitus TaxID=2950438 RepID=UPI002340B112|nr:hypothetical protein [Terrihalobacillus insolitus]MDC3412959.1 hypothetical protein [Terrihalobacillus insolitus]